MLLPPMVCSAWLLPVGVRFRAAGYASRKRDAARREAFLFLDAHPAALPEAGNIVGVLYHKL